ncbi:MAG: DUF6427 family protein [Bacteroidales bacterium]|jgi:hypothetical protein|nr:DUF6427 family protein [Bacteroidales bacterium]
MFVNIFKKRYIPQLLIIGITPVILWCIAFIKPPQVVETSFDMLLYTYFHSLLGDMPLFATVIAFILMIINGLLLNYIFTSNKLVQKTTYMPAFLYYLLSSSNYRFMTMSSLLLMNLCLIVALWCFYQVYSRKESTEEIFSTSLIISIGTMFYAPTVFFMLWIWIGFFIYKAYHIKKWFISIFGFITPFIFTVVYYYLTDQLAERFHWFINTFVRFPTIYSISKPIDVVYLVGLGLLLIPSLFYVRNSKIENNIIYGKKCSILTILLFVALLPMAYVMDYSEFSAFFSIPLSFMITIFLFARRKLLYSNIILFLLILITFVKIYFTFIS